MYDYYLKFADEATAKTTLAAYLTPDGDWPGNVLRTGGPGGADLKFWRASQDVAGTDADGNPTVTHSYLPGFFILYSDMRLIPALRDAAFVQVVLDRDKAIKRQAGGVIKSTVPIALLKDLRWSPVWAGDSPPWGTMS